MTASKTHAYRDHTISPVQYADKAAQGYRWYVETTHGPTGISYDSQHCPHYFTLAQAKEAIDQRIADYATCEE